MSSHPIPLPNVLTHIHLHPQCSWREGSRLLYVVSLSLHCPSWELLIGYFRNFRHLLASLLSTASSWGRVTQSSQANDNVLAWARGVWIWLTKTDVVSGGEKKKKENGIFSPRKCTILHKCFSLGICSTHKSLVIPLVLVLWMEKLNYTPGLQVLTWQLDHRALFLFLD